MIKMIKPAQLLLGSLASLSFCFSSLAFAGEDKPFGLEAKNISYLENGDVIEASGTVKVKSDKYGLVEADTVRYYHKNEHIIATGNVVFTTPEGLVTRSHHIELDQNFKTGLVKSLNMRLGKYENAHLTAESAKLENNKVYLENALYSACPIPKQDDVANLDTAPAPVWQIRSDNIVIDKEKESVTYKDMWFDIYGQPVFWLPWLRHPANPNKAVSGILPPSVGTSGNRGQEIETSFYWRQDKHNDAMLNARYMTKRGLLLTGEQRFIRNSTSGVIRAGIIDDDKLDTRNFIDGSVEHVIKEGLRAGINVQSSSDDTFYDDFLGFNPNFLESNIYAEDTSLTHYFGLKSTYFRDMRSGQPSNFTPQPLLQGDFNKKFKTSREGEEVFVSGNLLTLDREIGTDVNRLIASVGWQKHINTGGGNLFDLQAQVNGALYNIHNNPTTKEWEERLVPEVSAMWQNPFISPGGKHTITPMTKVIASPTGNNSRDIPNEESVFFELDASNIFDNNRFAGNDRVENGLRVIYGVENTWTRNFNRLFSLFVGQSYRAFDDNNFAANSGAATKFSDWVGQARAQSGIFTLSNRFRLDNNNLSPRRVDTFVTAGNLDSNYLGVAHTFLDDGPEEIRTNAQLELNKKWSVAGQWQQNLNTGGKLLGAQGKLTYTHCCYKVSFVVKRRGFENRNVNSSTDYLINFELLSLGRSREQ